MTLEDFQSFINGKYFVELTSQDAVSSFTRINNQESEAIRSIATSSGVLVFLKTINKIFARGTYYGASDELVAKVNELYTTIQSMGTPLANLAGLVATNQSNIAKLVTLIGTSELPEETNNILTRISNLETEISRLTGGTSLSDAVDQMVDNRLDTVLNSRISDYLTTNEYVTQDDLDALEQTIGSSISDLENALSEKAAQTDFGALVKLIGAGNIDSANWGHNNTSVVTVVNNLLGTTQTLTTDVSNLRTTISGIPKFEISVVDTLPTITPTDHGTASLSTIYLVLSPQDEQEASEVVGETSKEMYTEYICINENAGKTGNNPATGEPWQSSYKWEKLGRQAFKMSQYLTEEQITNITDALSDTLESLIADVLGDNNEEITTPIINQIETINTTITTIQGQITTIQSTLDSLIQNGVLQFTGEDIKTTAAGNTTIATDISSLQTNISTLQNSKLDSNAMSWVIINENITNVSQEPEPEPEP